MKIGSRRTIFAGLGLAAMCLFGVALAGSQAQPDEKPLMAEDVFHNVQVLRGIPADEFMGTMSVFSAALGMSCEDCHAAGDTDWADFANDNNERKITARRMVLMMNAINRANFQGEQMVTCYSCHRGGYRPAVTPSLDDLYSGFIPRGDDRFEQSPWSPAPDEVLDKYLEAVGGTQELSGITSFVARGTSVGYGPEGDRPVEIYARAPNQRTMIMRTESGDNTTTFDGRSGWHAAPFRPVDVMPYTGDELESLRVEVELSFPARTKEVLTDWRVGPPTTIEGRQAYSVQGDAAGGAFATLYIDQESGLLVRLMRYADSAVGRMVSQVDFGDYREISGVMFPFSLTISWLGGREIIELTDVEFNVAIDDARFARPSPPVAPAQQEPGPLQPEGQPGMEKGRAGRSPARPFCRCAPSS